MSEDENRFREGMVFSFEETISSEMINHFAALSGDVNPLHMDASYARAHGFSGRVAHGELLGALFSRLIGMYCPGEGALLHFLNLRFHNPVYSDTMLMISGMVAQVSLGNSAVILRLEAKDAVSGLIYAAGKAQVGFCKKDVNDRI